ncbi:hypothetical protein [Virgibacillus siamensis]|uniref:hypothetical protein n=1 Tax=Virgibacillus siamensis TaxID=480071 RepID=UPI000984B693|nr:hypothetical protein [Virgibacillus siamensis]
MSKSEKNWRRFYLILMIFIYGIFVPVTVFEWLAGSEGFPLTAIVVGFALPLMRKNHLTAIWEKEGKQSS